ncbi:hypothetical protein ACFWVT_17500 [Streptomyces cyaneofuscatus]|uniref:hypothetical protein n=1 Tax=Streptomyces cyaneofuscatus TaxID=66883 RepID=UPI0036685820
MPHRLHVRTRPVFAINQGCHGVEVLRADGSAISTAADRLKAFFAGEHARLPEGPWLLMNGGDHLAPTGPGARIREAADGAAATGAALRESALEEFCGAARAAADARAAHGDPLPAVANSANLRGT